MHVVAVKKNGLKRSFRFKKMCPLGKNFCFILILTLLTKYCRVRHVIVVRKNCLKRSLRFKKSCLSIAGHFFFHFCSYIMFAFS